MSHTKRIRIVSSMFLGAFGVFCLLMVGIVPRLCGSDEPFALVGGGIVLMVVAIPFHICGGRNHHRAGNAAGIFYGVVLILNALGVALGEAAYYTHIEAHSPGSAFIAGMVILLGITALLWLLLMIFPARYAGVTLAGGLLTLGLTITALVMWIRCDGTPDAQLWSFLFFTLLGLLAVTIALYAALEDTSGQIMSCLRYVSFASFGLLLVVAAIVLLILMCAAGDCDCDCGDGCCDGCDCPTGSGKKKKSG